MSKRIRILLAVAVLVLAALAGGIWWYLRDDAPDEVAIASAVAAASATDPADPAGAADTSAATDPIATPATDGVAATSTPAGSNAADTATSATGAATSSTAGIAGTWVIDPEFGEFDYQSATGSFVGFRVNEQLSGIGSATAVGRTGNVTGSLTIEGTTLTAADFEADLSTITTDRRQRDDRVRSALGTREFPTATFVLTAPVELGAAAADGGPVTVTATGDLTIRGVTKSIEFDVVDAQLVAATDRIALVGSTEIVFADFGVSVPSAPIVLSADDHGILELQFILERAA